MVQHSQGSFSGQREARGGMEGQHPQGLVVQGCVHSRAEHRLHNGEDEVVGGARQGGAVGGGCCQGSHGGNDCRPG